MYTQSVAARDASVPLQVTDRVRVLPRSDREVYLGTSAEGTILVPMKNRWGSVSTLLAHARVAVNFDVREHQMEFMAVEAMGPPAMLRASFRKVDVEGVLMWCTRLTSLMVHLLRIRQCLCCGGAQIYGRKCILD